MQADAAVELGQREVAVEPKPTAAPVDGAEDPAVIGDVEPVGVAERVEDEMVLVDVQRVRMNLRERDRSVGRPVHRYGTQIHLVGGVRVDSHGKVVPALAGTAGAVGGPVPPEPPAVVRAVDRHLGPSGRLSLQHYSRIEHVGVRRGNRQDDSLRTLAGNRLRRMGP